MKPNKGFIVLTIVNLILLILILIGYIETSENLKIFNSTDDAFDYEEKEEGEVELALTKGKKVTVLFYETNVEIREAYRFTDKEEVIGIIRFIRFYCEEKGVKITRENSDLWGEMRLHTVLYDVGYKRAQTGNANIDFEEDERWYVGVAGSILGWIGI